MPDKIKTLVISAFIALTLNACQTVSIDSKTGYDLICAQTEYEDIKITGRIGFISPREKISLRFVLDRDKNLKTLHLLSPVGHTIASVFMTDNFVRFKSSDVQKDGGSLKELLADVTGITLPHDDILALIMGAVSDVSLNKDGYPEHAIAGEFEIDYKNFAKRQSLLLPKSIDIKSIDYRLKIALDD